MLALLVVRGIRSWRALVAGPRRSGGQLRSSRSRHADQSRERTVLTILDENARAYIRESIGHRPPVNSLRALTMRPRASRPYTAAVLRALSGCSASGVAGLSTRDVALRRPGSVGCGHADDLVPGGESGVHLVAVTGCWPRRRRRDRYGRHHPVGSLRADHLQPQPGCGRLLAGLVRHQSEVGSPGAARYLRTAQGTNR
jgi:hypothetical protein